MRSGIFEVMLNPVLHNSTQHKDTRSRPVTPSHFSVMWPAWYTCRILKRRSNTPTVILSSRFKPQILVKEKQRYPERLKLLDTCMLCVAAVLDLVLEKILSAAPLWQGLSVSFILLLGLKFKKVTSFISAWCAAALPLWRRRMRYFLLVKQRWELISWLVSGWLEFWRSSVESVMCRPG